MFATQCFIVLTAIAVVLMLVIWGLWALTDRYGFGTYWGAAVALWLVGGWFYAYFRWDDLDDCEEADSDPA